MTEPEVGLKNPLDRRCRSGCGVMMSPQVHRLDGIEKRELLLHRQIQEIFTGANADNPGH
jgi:hypothetical protein